MTSKSVTFLMADLGVTKTHSRPHVSDDNPHFKTMKYQSDYLVRFGSLPDARSWTKDFFSWYNQEHHHNGIGLLTPADVHFDRATIVRQQRQQVLKTAYQDHPERFVKGLPVPPKLPLVAWINPPKEEEPQ